MMIFMYKKIIDNVYSVGAVDWDRTVFDSLIPLPYGTTYNSYFIFGSEKNVLIDTVEPSKERVLIENLKFLNVSKIDYIVAHHAEQDHSGSLPKILELYPEAKVVTNSKCKEMLRDHLLIADDRFIVVNDGDALSLGDRTLKFIFAPWVHWPETMFSYLVEDKILFTCDFLGSHLATSDLFATHGSKVYGAAKRYYAEIMMPFRQNIKNNLAKIKDLPIRYIGTSHGPMYDDPQFMIDAYKKWIDDKCKNEVVVPYASMHGTTKVMAEYLVDSLISKGVTAKPFNIPTGDIGEFAMALVDAATIVFGSSTVLSGSHPGIIFAAYLANSLRPKARYFSVIGSYGWGGKMTDQIVGMIPLIKGELVSPVVIKGYPKEGDFTSLDHLADEIFTRHKANEFVLS